MSLMNKIGNHMRRGIIVRVQAFTRFAGSCTKKNKNIYYEKDLFNISCTVYIL